MERDGDMNKLDSGTWALEGKCVETYMPNASLIKTGKINANKLVNDNKEQEDE